MEISRASCWENRYSAKTRIRIRKETLTQDSG